jgi:hypothetical protein
MTSLHECLRPTITALLAQEGTEPGSAMMPHQGSWVESDLPSTVEDTPAEVDVVTRRGVHGVEAAHLDEDGFEKGHVATRNMLGPII